MQQIKVTQKGLRSSFIHDMYYLIIKTSWTKFFLIAGFLYILLNFLFALLYYYTPAEIINVRPNSLWDAFIFSFQTSSTLGYGYFVPKSDSAHLIVILDTIVGIFYVALVTGMAFSKFARPSAKILFTNKMIIGSFDNIPTLIFRIANGRETNIVDASLKLSAFIPYVSKEGFSMRRSFKLKLLSDENPIFLLAWTVMHQITEDSPLHGMTLSELKEQKIMFFTSFTGIDDVLSQTIHSNYKYTSNEIIASPKFKDILTVKSENVYELDYHNFHECE